MRTGVGEGVGVGGRGVSVGCGVAVGGMGVAVGREIVPQPLRISVEKMTISSLKLDSN